MERGIGKEAPKEFREPLRSFMLGDRLRLCMYGEASAMLLRVAGTSILLWPVSPGTGKLFPKLAAVGLVVLPFVRTR